MLSQDVVHQMGGAVVPLDVLTAGRLDPGLQRRGLELLAKGPADHGSLCVLANGVYLEGQPWCRHFSDVAYLATRLRVKGILLQHQLHSGTILPEREHIGVGLRGAVAYKLLLAPLDGAPLFRSWKNDGRSINSARRCSSVRGRDGHCTRGSRGSGPGPLLLERALEPLQIHYHAALFSNDAREIDGKSEGVVEAERLLTLNGARSGGEDLVQPSEPPFDCLKEAALLRL